MSMNLAESLQAINGYPIPLSLAINILESEDLVPFVEATTETRNTAAYMRAKATTYKFLSTAPNVSQGGISYSFSDADKAKFLSIANELMDKADELEGSETSRVRYGYIGDNY